MQQQQLFIPGPTGPLQAIYQQGDRELPAIVVCHPHPQFGGTMRNKVVFRIARAFSQLGYSVLRFNYRGVEQSEGVWDEGRGEADDAAAALDWLHAQQPDAALWLAGFSFGCYAGLQAASKNKLVQRMFAIAPAVHMHDFSFMKTRPYYHTPCTVIAAEKDEIVPYHAILDWIENCPNCQLHSLAEASHFFPQHLPQLMTILANEAESSIVKSIPNSAAAEVFDCKTKARSLRAGK